MQSDLRSEKGDKLIFQSSKDTILKDTITILEKEITIPSGDCNPMVSLNDPEAFVVNYTYNHNGKLSDSDYFIQHIKEEEGLSFCCGRFFLCVRVRICM